MLAPKLLKADGNVLSRNALVMCLTPILEDPRPRRAVELLQSRGFSVDILSPPTQDSILINRRFELNVPSRKLHLRIFQRLHYNGIRLLRFFSTNSSFRDRLIDYQLRLQYLENQFLNKQYTLILVEDLYLLPLASRLRRDGAVIFDAREYYPRQNEESWRWRIFERPERIRLCKNYLANCDHVITVSPGLASEYSNEFGVVPSIIISAPKYVDISPTATKEGVIRLVHHGMANPNRQLEKMIDVVSLLDDRFTLDLYLVGSLKYITYLRRYAKDSWRVRIFDSVPFDKIGKMLSNYDVGFFYNEPTTFNLLHCLPNKLFEFVQARLAVAVGPSPDMSLIIKQFNCGVVAEEFSIQSMANALRALTPKIIDEMKQRSHLAAKTLNFETQSIKLAEIIDHFTDMA